MKRPLRIAQIGSRGIPGHSGGVERVLEAVTPRLASMGHVVTVYCATWSRNKEPEYKGVRLRYVPSIRSKYFDTIIRSALATLLELAGRSDIVHFHGSGSAPLALLARLFGKKVVVTVHGLDWQREKWNSFARRFIQLGERAAVRVPHRTVVVGRELKRILDSRHGSNAIFIPNGVEPRTPRAADRILELGLEPRRYLLYLGRLVPEKRCHLLIRAFKSLTDRGDLKLVIAGPAWHSAEYVASLHELAGSDPGIVFAGEVEEPLLEELYSNCLAYVLPSAVEGMSLSLLDAMAFGSCVVASDIAPNVEVVGDAGACFKTGDEPDLIEKLHAIVTNPRLAERYRTAARERISAEFQWDKIATQWEAMYEGVAGRTEDSMKERR